MLYRSSVNAHKQEKMQEIKQVQSFVLNHTKSSSSFVMKRQNCSGNKSPLAIRTELDEAIIDEASELDSETNRGK
jgi:hypothetical protein